MKYFAAIFAALLLCQSTAGDALIASQAKLEATALIKSALARNEAVLAEHRALVRTRRATVTTPDMNDFAGQVVDVVQNLNLLNRDVIAQLVLFSDGAFGSLAQVSTAIQALLTVGNIVLSLFPFGPLISIATTVIFNVVMAPQTKFLVQYFLLRIWDLIPSTGSEVYNLILSNDRILVVSAATNATAYINPLSL
ncbi:hypothetical protein HDE_13564 [Halotydeus destructor]|nr:hypothetical protein HDE_13564 [Halotydeus destructor]